MQHAINYSYDYMNVLFCKCEFVWQPILSHSSHSSIEQIHAWKRTHTNKTNIHACIINEKIANKKEKYECYREVKKGKTIKDISHWKSSK